MNDNDKVLIFGLVVCVVITIAYSIHIITKF